MYDYISIPEDWNFLCAVYIPEGTCVYDARDMCYKLKDELIQKGISSDRFTIFPVGMGSPVNDLKIIPENRSVALWVEYPAAHYFKCSVCVTILCHTKKLCLFETVVAINFVLPVVE